MCGSLVDRRLRKVAGIESRSARLSGLIRNSSRSWIGVRNWFRFLERDFGSDNF